MSIIERQLARREFMAGMAMMMAVAPAVAKAGAAAKAMSRPGPYQPLLREVAQLVIPRGETPGAGEVGVGAFVLIALAHGLEGTHRPAPKTWTGHVLPDGRWDYAAWLQSALGRGFLAQPVAKRHAALAALDAAAFAPEAGPHPWVAIKRLILLGYYSSETGASKELRYEHVPGRYDPDLPLKPSDRAFSSDWTAVDFG